MLSIKNARTYIEALSYMILISIMALSIAEYVVRRWLKNVVPNALGHI